jgi:hypothetical protein
MQVLIVGILISCLLIALLNGLANDDVAFGDIFPGGAVKGAVY